MGRNEKVCRAHGLGPYAQGQGHSQDKGQNLVSAITQKLLGRVRRNFTGGWSIMRSVSSSKVKFLRPGSGSQSGQGSNCT